MWFFEVRIYPWFFRPSNFSRAHQGQLKVDLEKQNALKSVTIRVNVAVLIFCEPHVTNDTGLGAFSAQFKCSCARASKSALSVGLS
jgi:hypothetical protein